MSMTDLEQTQAQLFELPALKPAARVRNKLLAPKDWDSMFNGEKLVLDEDDKVTVQVTCIMKNPPWVDTKRNKAGQKIGVRTAFQYLQPIEEPEVMTVDRKAER
jgi:hypothetical protein